MIYETAWAKINLALHVRRRRTDGYHDIESLFAFAQDGDALACEAADTLSLEIDGPFSAGLETGADNLVLRAAYAMKSAFGVAGGARLILTKNLPVAAGIGGGSADAAAALRVLARLWRLEHEDPRFNQIALALGADVPACLASRTLRGEGKGDSLDFIADSSLTGMPLLLVNPRIPLETGPVFAAWNGQDRGALADGEPLSASIAGRNDLEPPAMMLVPEIGALAAMMKALDGVVLARMSGSGATCFALFDDIAAREAGAGEIKKRWPDYWCLETALK